MGGMGCILGESREPEKEEGSLGIPVRRCKSAVRYPLPASHPRGHLWRGTTYLTRTWLLYSITYGCVRSKDQPWGQLIHTLAPCTLVPLWNNPWIRNFPSRSALADLVSWMEVQDELRVNMDSSSPAKGEQMQHIPVDSYCRCSPQLRNVWETLVTLFLRCCKEDLFCK